MSLVESKKKGKRKTRLEGKKGENGRREENVEQEEITRKKKEKRGKNIQTPSS
jgi:hypothetical protein